MRQIKNVMRPLAIAFVLGFGAQSGQATGIPTIDGAVLGNNMQDFLSNVAEYAEEAARWTETLSQWKTELEQWEKDFAVATESFDMANDLLSIYDSVGQIAGMVEDVKKMADDIEKNGAEGLANKAFDRIKTTVYNSRSKPVQNSCAGEDALKEALSEFDGKYIDKTAENAKQFEKLAKKIEKKDTSTNKGQSVNAAMTTLQSKQQEEDAQFKKSRALIVSKLETASESCRNAIVAEAANMKQQAVLSEGGGGLISNDSSSGSSSGSGQSMF